MGMTIDGGRFAANLDDVIALADFKVFASVADNRSPQACCAASGLPASSKPPAACQPRWRVQRSRRTARCRWLSARTMLDSASFSDEVFGFHAQQTIEKALKAWIAVRGLVYPKSHDVSFG
jgi:hypothetical protein